MSKPTTPASRHRTAQSATSTDRRSRRLAHRRDDRTNDDRPAGRGGVRAADPEAVEDRFLDLVEGQPLLRAQLGSHPDLGVDDAVGRKVLRALGGHARDRVAILHDAEGVLERLQVELQRLPVGSPPEPRGQLAHVLGWQVAVSELASEIHHGRGPKPTVEMVVEQRLRRLSDGFERQHRVPPEVRAMVSPGPSEPIGCRP
jgi:hypothetical protein